MSNEIRVAALGQTLIKYDIRQYYPEQFMYFKKVFSDYHFVVSDIEAAVRATNSEPTRQDGSPTHIIPPELIQVFDDLGINLLSAACNHTWDLGTENIAASIPVLSQYSFAFAGIGNNRFEASKAGYLNRAGTTAAVLAAASGKLRGTAPAAENHPGVFEIRIDEQKEVIDKNDLDLLVRQIADAKAKAQLVCFIHHNHIWGNDLFKTPKWLSTLAKTCIDAGADIFLGHGAPLLHGIELYKGRPLLYNLGSFIFNTQRKERWLDAAYWQTVIADCRMSSSGELLSLRLQPLSLDVDGNPRGFPFVPSEGVAAEIILRLAEISNNDFGTVIIPDGHGAEVIIR